ncbi:peptide-methionine (S)-S-oxide reductase MsrA [Bizionia sediminis]|uniref:Peptide methionine sulfoxide reductase MsrA n=1 Tax=Bizionia sediminis TaxID=1737064 RepID=A0ABW5KRX0_9FLAO
MAVSLPIATVGAGCFWCWDAFFKNVIGVKEVTSGYMGGTVPGRPTYREVSSGLTGHAEIVRIRFQPEIISYTSLLTLFLKAHNPTISYKTQHLGSYGSQYRSVIFYQNTAQQKAAILVLKQFEKTLEPAQTLYTELAPATIFYEAETAHQNYYETNKTAAYCTNIIVPKLRWLEKQQAKKLK